MTHLYTTLAVAPFVLHQVVFWSYSLFLQNYTSIENNDAQQYKLQPKKIATKDEVIKCVKAVLFNQFFLILPFSYFLAPVLSSNSAHLEAFAEDMSISFPNLILAPLQFVACMYIAEVIFYYSHRALVSPSARFNT